MKNIDPKYGIDFLARKICKVRTGEPIPDDEPLILFRARDRLALPTLEHYMKLAVADGCVTEHLEGIDNRIKAFEQFRTEHPERMKQPGITRGL